ncbi:MAG TPA: hypothetical protein VFH49_15940, partial [Aquabacterium sp.]|nr:hypothetical protein [Aquabacterium sp.]
LVSGAATGIAPTDIHANNSITLNNATVKGQDVSLMAGADAFGQVNLIDGFANADVQAYSLLPNIAVPAPTVNIAEVNAISVLGNSKVQALEDVVIRAQEGLGGDERGTTDGTVLSLSLIPYGVSVPDGAHASSSNTVSIATTARVDAGVNNQALVHIRSQVADPVALDTELSASEKTALGLSPDLHYEYSRLNLDAIPFSISTGTIIERVSGAGLNGTVGHYYKFLPVSDISLNVVLETEDFSNASRWQDLGAVAPDPSENTVYRSDVTGELRDALTDKFYVIKPVDMDAPSFVYKNLGNLLLEQRETVLAWIESHGSDAEAVARYQVQLDLINEALDELGLVEVVDGVTLIKRELDVLFLELPNIYATPGSVFITADTVRNGSGVPTTVNALISAGAVIARAGAEIEIVNNTPFTMQVNDAIIRDTKRVAVVNGAYTVLTPGNVYLNDAAVTNEADNAAKTVTITQDAMPLASYGIDTSSLPGFTSAPDQDMYIVGDIINEVGDVTIVNNEGSITVSGEIRGNPVVIEAAKDFTL